MQCARETRTCPSLHSGFQRVRAHTPCIRSSIEQQRLRRRFRKWSSAFAETVTPAPVRSQDTCASQVSGLLKRLTRIVSVQRSMRRASTQHQAPAGSEPDPAAQPSVKAVLLYVPNIIGYVRLGLLAAGCMMAHTQRLQAAVMFFITSIALDAVDGYAARRLKQVRVGTAALTPDSSLGCTRSPNQYNVSTYSIGRDLCICAIM